MPGGMTKVNGYKVRWGGKTVAKRTTKRKGRSQLNLLRAKKHGWKPTGKPARVRGKRVRLKGRLGRSRVRRKYAGRRS